MKIWLVSGWVGVSEVEGSGDSILGVSYKRVKVLGKISRTKNEDCW
jgi:hypothetical protein